MARTHNKHIRVFVDGVDISGYARSVGALNWAFDAEPDAAITDAVKNILIGKCDIQAGPISAFLDNDTAGLYVLAGKAAAGKGTRNLMVSIGTNAAPAKGDNVFAWKMEQTDYSVEQGSGFVAVNIPFGGSSSQGTLVYKKPWGHLLLPKTDLTSAGGVNTGTGIDDIAGTSALGGIFVYHLTASNGNLTLKAEDADGTNIDADFAASTLDTVATSGLIDASVSPKHGMVALSSTLAIKRYIRYQVAWGTATTATFTVAFIRNNLP